MGGPDAEAPTRGRADAGAGKAGVGQSPRRPASARRPVRAAVGAETDGQAHDELPPANLAEVVGVPGGEVDVVQARERAPEGHERGEALVVGPDVERGIIGIHAEPGPRC